MKKLRVFSDRLFISSHEGGGGGRRRCTGWLMGGGLETVGWGGATARWGAIVGGGQHWGCFQPLRTSLHTISISLQNSFS